MKNCVAVLHGLLILIQATSTQAQDPFFEAQPHLLRRFDDGQWHPEGDDNNGHGNGEPEQPNHIGAVLEAARNLLDQEYPDGLPSDLDVGTLKWPGTFTIHGSTYSGIPSTSATLTTSMSASATSSISTTSETSTKSTKSSSSSSSSSSSTATHTPTDTPDHEEPSSDSDRKAAIAIGVIVGGMALMVAVVVFALLIRRKRRTGEFFKTARCSECMTTPTSSMMFGNSVRSAPSRLRSAYPGSAEGLPTPMERAHVHSPHDGSANEAGDHLFGAVVRRAPSLIDSSGLTRPHELAGDDLGAINEMDGESPTRTASAMRNTVAASVVVPPNSEPLLNWYQVARSDSDRTDHSQFADFSQQPTEMDSESPTRRALSPSNPFNVIRLAASSESGWDSSAMSRSNSDRSAAYGEYPRHISELPSNADDVAHQLPAGEEEYNAIGSRQFNESFSTAVSNAASPYPVVIMQKATPSNSTTDLVAAETSRENSIDAHADDELSSAATSMDLGRSTPDIRTTDIIIPDVSSADTSPTYTRSLAPAPKTLSKLSKVSAHPPADPFAPAGVYASSPLWRKRLRGPFTPGAIPSPLSSIGTTSDTDEPSHQRGRIPIGLLASASTEDLRRNGAGPGAVYSSSPLWKKPRPKPLSPAHPPELPPLGGDRDGEGEPQGDGMPEVWHPGMPRASSQFGRETQGHLTPQRGAHVMTPSLSEMDEFDFDGVVEKPSMDDGYRPVRESVLGRYELVS